MNINKEFIVKLCQDIAFPEDIFLRVSKVIDTYDFSKVETYINDLLDMETSEEAIKQIDEILCDEVNKGDIWISIYLIASTHTYAKYIDKNIGYDIFSATMRFATRKATEYKPLHGCDGFDGYIWGRRHISLTLFRLGTLEYEMRTYQGEDITVDGVKLCKGDNLLSVHIPSDVALTPENCHASYKEAVDFFAKYYPDFQYEFFHCNSWLLSPDLPLILNEKSKILGFRSKFNMIGESSKESYKEWAFKIMPDDKRDVRTFPENTSLQKTIKSYVLAGKTIREGEGVFSKNTI